MIGEVEKEYHFNDDNTVGDPKGEIGYAHQITVNWWDSPKDFNRNKLPDEIQDWVAIPGTVYTREFRIGKFRKNLEKI